MWGRAFAIGAVVYEDGVEVKTFYARCPIEGKVDTWVEENVLPQMVDMVETHATYEQMLKAFAEFSLKTRKMQILSSTWVYLWKLASSLTCMTKAISELGTAHILGWILQVV